MRTEFRHYIHSFKVGSDFLYTLAVDSLCILLLGFMIAEAGQWIARTAFTITGGRSSEELQTYILSLPAEQLTAVTGQFRSLALELIAVMVLLPIFALLLFSLCQMLIWSILSHKSFSFEKYWKWVVLSFLSIISLFGAFALLIFTRLLLSFVTTWDSASGFVLIIILCGFFAINFIICQEFVHSLMIWKSVGHAFTLIAQNRKHSLMVFGFGLLTLFVLQIIQYPFSEQLYFHPQVSLAVQFALFVIWLAWMRNFVVQSVPKHSPY